MKFRNLRVWVCNVPFIWRKAELQVIPRRILRRLIECQRIELNAHRWNCDSNNYWLLQCEFYRIAYSQNLLLQIAICEIVIWNVSVSSVKWAHEYSKIECKINCNLLFVRILTAIIEGALGCAPCVCDTLTMHIASAAAVFEIYNETATHNSIRATNYSMHRCYEWIMSVFLFLTRIARIPQTIIIRNAPHTLCTQTLTDARITEYALKAMKQWNNENRNVGMHSN